jgi:hypothetical protein
MASRLLTWETQMEVSFHDIIDIKAESSYGETASWVELIVTERSTITGVTRSTVVFFTKDKDSILCARLAQVINQCFADAIVQEVLNKETPNEVA